MKLKWMLIFFIIALIGVGVYFVMNMKPSIKEEPTLTDLNSFLLHVRAIDEQYAQEISDFRIVLDNGKTYSLISNLNDFESIRIPKNTSFTIFNINSSKFYTNKLKMDYNDGLMSGGFQVNYPLTNIGTLNISRDNTLDKIVNFNVISNNTFRFIEICLRWSPNIVYSKIPQYQEVGIPSRLNNKVDKCFDTQQSLKDGESFNFTLNTFYTTFTKDADYVNLYFIDGDIDYTTNQPTTGDNTDVGAKDILIVLK